MKENKRIEVVAALIFNERGEFLICQRPENKARGLLWEFVGGKREEGETRQDALVRECREELDVELKPKEIFMELDHDYPDLDIHLTLFRADISEGNPTLKEHKAMRWISPSEIDGYKFCPADYQILEEIKRQAKR